MMTQTEQVPNPKDAARFSAASHLAQQAFDAPRSSKRWRRVLVGVAALALATAEAAASPTVVLL